MTEIILHNSELEEKNDIITLGFWVYLMTDLVMFAVLFATYAVLRVSTFGGPTTHDIIKLPFVLIETLILLTSSFTIGLAMLALNKQKTNGVLVWLVATMLLGSVFLSMELYEFKSLLHEGASFTRSAFLSSYFVLVGTHGLHIAIGLLWVLIMILVVARRGLTSSNSRKLVLFSLFWHFLDIVWIFIFTIVYLMGTMR